MLGMVLSASLLLASLAPEVIDETPQPSCSGCAITTERFRVLNDIHGGVYLERQSQTRGPDDLVFIDDSAGNRAKLDAEYQRVTDYETLLVGVYCECTGAAYDRDGFHHFDLRSFKLVTAPWPGH